MSQASTDPAVRSGRTIEAPTGFVAAAARALSNRHMELVILPTEKCNFRCTYCYEDFELGRMSSRVQTACIRFLRRRLAELESLDIKWFGGEPLLALDVIERINGAILSELPQRPLLSFSSSITTNGYLLDSRTVARLVAAGVEGAQVSLDGPRKFHDATRLQAGGQGSYGRILENLDAIRASDSPFSVLIRLHLTPDNISACPEFVETLARRYLADERFTLFFMPVAKLGGPNDASMPVLSHGEAATWVRSLKEIAHQALGKSTSARDDHRNADPQPPPWSVCYAAQPNAFVIRSDGGVGKCTVALRKPANAIGRLGDNGEIRINQDRHRLWLSGWERQDRDALHCPYESLPELQHDTTRTIQWHART